MKKLAHTPRWDWTEKDIQKIHDLPFPELLYRAQGVHRIYHDPNKIQFCTLLSIKTGGCPEDCAYCPQSVHNETRVQPIPALQVKSVLDRAKAAKATGADRFCMGWAWREIKDGNAFDSMLEMVRGVRELGLEACVTAGMITDSQASRLAEAGLTAYNHNLDTSPEYYSNIISTRTYQDRLETLKRVRMAGITVCCGGIIGMGESLSDRASLLKVLATLNQIFIVKITLKKYCIKN